MKVLITGGGTAGHVMPALEVIKEIKQQVPDCEFMWVGSRTGMEKEIVEKAGISFKGVATGKIRRYFSLKNLVDPLKIPGGVLQAGKIISAFKPQVVFSKGGFASIPTVLAAWMQNIPIVSHESDIVPGLANKKLSWFTTKIALTFEDAHNYFPKEKVFVAGMPIRQEIFSGDKARAKTRFQFREEKPVLLVMGGSQGAQALNEALLPILPELVQKFNVLHLCGDANYYQTMKETESYVTEGSYRLFAYLHEEMPDALALADVVVSRAGMTSIFELVALGKRALLIPLAESANNHQQENAEYFDKLGVARTLVEKNLKSHILYKNILEMFYDFKEEDVKKSGSEIVHLDAAKTITEWIIKLSHYGNNKV